MISRSEAMQAFVDAATAAFAECARDAPSRRSVDAIASLMQVPVLEAEGPGARLPVCRHLDVALGRALSAVESNPGLERLIEAFRRIEPDLVWRRRPSGATASAHFEDGHANAMILGPGGREDRQDVWLGATLMAPQVRYPDHDHAPEEVYLVLSDGEFRQADGDWFAPGVGGSFYNEPGIRHAMRSLDVPLLAFWALRPDRTARARP